MPQAIVERPRSLKANFVWTLSGNVIGTGCQWVLIVLLAKLTNPAMVGQLALALAVAGPITFFADFRLRVLYVTDHTGRYDFSEMLGLRFVLACVAVVIVTMTCLIAHFPLETAVTVVIVALSQLTDFVSESFYGEFQKNERMDRIAKSMATRNILAACGFTTVIYVTRNLIMATVALVVARCLTLLLYDSAARAKTLQLVAGVNNAFLARLQPAWNLRRQRAMLLAALPLAIISLLISLNGYVPRYVLEADLGKRDLGIYSAINYIPTGCFMIASAIGYAVFARLSRLFGNGDLQAFKTLLLKIILIYTGMGVAGVLVSIVIGPAMLRIVYGPEYAGEADILRWLMLVGAVQTITTAVQCGLTAASRFAVQVPLFASVTFASFVGCMLLVPRFKLEGAAIAVLIASAVQLCGSTALMLRTVANRARQLESNSDVALAAVSVS